MPVRLCWTKAHTKEEPAEAYWNAKVDQMAKDGAKSLLMRVVEESGLVLGAVGGDDEEDDRRRGVIVLVAHDKLKEWQEAREQWVRDTGTGAMGGRSGTVVSGATGSTAAVANGSGVDHSGVQGMAGKGVEDGGHMYRTCGCNAGQDRRSLLGGNGAVDVNVERESMEIEGMEQSIGTDITADACCRVCTRIGIG